MNLNTMTAQMLGVASLAIVSCSDLSQANSTSDQVMIPPAEVDIAATDVTSAGAFHSENALQEIVSLTNICRSIVSEADQRTIEEFTTVLEESGYSSDPNRVQGVSSPTGRAVEYLDKDGFETYFAISWPGNGDRCVTLIGDLPGAPELDDVQSSFLSQGWRKSGVIGSSTQAAEAAVMSRDNVGDSIVAVISENPEPGSNIAIGILVSAAEL